MPSHSPYPREAFERQRLAARKIQQRGGVRLAVSSIVLGAVLLFVISRAETWMGRTAHLVFAAGAFLIYLLGLGVQLLALQASVRKARLVCPSCGVLLDDVAERIALADGICDTCGDRVIE